MSRSYDHHHHRHRMEPHCVGGWVLFDASFPEHYVLVWVGNYRDNTTCLNKDFVLLYIYNVHTIWQ